MRRARAAQREGTSAWKPHAQSILDSRSRTSLTRAGGYCGDDSARHRKAQGGGVEPDGGAGTQRCSERFARCTCSSSCTTTRTSACKPRSVIMRSTFARMTSIGASLRGFEVSVGGGGIGGTAAAPACSLDDRPIVEVKSGLPTRRCSATATACVPPDVAAGPFTCCFNSTNCCPVSRFTFQPRVPRALRAPRSACPALCVPRARVSCIRANRLYSVRATTRWAP